MRSRQINRQSVFPIPFPQNCGRKCLTETDSLARCAGVARARLTLIQAGRSGCISATSKTRAWAGKMSFQISVRFAPPAIRAQRTSQAKSLLRFGCFPRSDVPDRMNKRRFLNGCELNSVDSFNSQKRSEIMAKVRSRGNASTELKALQILRRGAVTGWRRHFPIFGRPDFAFPKARLALFIDGCFWHGCPRCYSAPKSSLAFWRQKLSKNRKRDLRACFENAFFILTPTV